MNLSTLPAESTNFCLPLKKGWHFEHTSTLMFGFVERVWMVLPHAQTITQSWYLG